MASKKQENHLIKTTCRAADIVPLDELMDFQGGIKTISKANLEKLKARIIRDGINVPAFVWQHKGKCLLLDGHQRRAALHSLSEDGYTIPPVPVAYIDAADEADARQKLLGITSQYGEFDTDELAAWLEDLDDSVSETLRLVDHEIDLLLEETAANTDGDDNVPDGAPAVTQDGDLWELGRHRLLCGDSTKSEPYQPLFGNVLADLYLTDPPYNVAYEGKTKEKLTIENDDMSDMDFRTFLASAFGAAAEVMKDGAAYYVWHADSEGYNFRGACMDVGFVVRQCIIWNKQSMVMGRQDYQWKHEPCLYGWKGGAGHTWYSDRKQTTVLEFDRPARSEEHPTMKPVALFEYLIKNNSKEGDVILDNFLGSGTTIIAAERSGRTCYGLELDPHYCDVIVNRYRQWMIENNREYTIKLNGKEWDGIQS